MLRQEDRLSPAVIYLSSDMACTVDVRGEGVREDALSQLPCEASCLTPYKDCARPNKYFPTTYMEISQEKCDIILHFSTSLHFPLHLNQGSLASSRDYRSQSEEEISSDARIWQILVKFFICSPHEWRSTLAVYMESFH